MSVLKKEFGKTFNGDKAYLYTIENSNGTKVEVTNYGATIVCIKVADKNGKFEDVVLGYKDLDGYLKGDKYLGATIGRCCNRIENGSFIIDNKEYKVTKNEGSNHLHGGEKGFDKVLWTCENISDFDDTIQFYYMSKDMEEGYPGNLKVRVIYTLTEEDALRIEYKATSDKDTIVNLTNHSYFNLSGDFNNKIYEHKLMIKAEMFSVNDEQSISKGEVRAVDGTPLDFRKPTTIGKNIKCEYDQLKIGHGYNENYILQTEENKLEKIAVLIEEHSGRVMEVHTTYPCLQVYTANFFDGKDIGKDDIRYMYHNSICLEAQYAPNSINYNSIKTPLLRKNEEYSHTIIYKFLCSS
ncbi:aldose epimerase family protein [Clostridium sp. C8-1-8]|uniref:aldose epimerase family protein n=1 Tax=Clostridium sp. C8-1-8 TaxID=2698831 RepID=UPI00136838F2|nr:aldose epimerase family protein [Clostridium sp. C8-1-8]